MAGYRIVCFVAAFWLLGCPLGAQEKADATEEEAGVKEAEEEQEAARLQKLWESLDPELREVLESLDSASQKVKDLQASVIYKRSIPWLEVEEECKGVLKFKRPDLIALELGKPRNEGVYMDGKQWWVVSHNDKQVEIYEATKTTDASREAAFLNFGYGRAARELLKDYEISLVKKEKVIKRLRGEERGEEKEQEKEFTEYHVRFVARKSEVAPLYDSVEIVVCDQTWLPHGIVLYESEGQIVHEFHLDKFKLNKNLKEDKFRYEPPRGYRVLRPGEF